MTGRRTKNNPRVVPGVKKASVRAHSLADAGGPVAQEATTTGSAASPGVALPPRVAGTAR